MQDIITGLRVLHGMSSKEAKTVATAMVTYAEARMLSGAPVDLGFVKLDPRKVRPRVVHSNLDHRKHFIGESVKWRLLFRRKWLHQKRPVWSRYL